MTMPEQDSWIRCREILEEGVARALSDLHFSQVEPLRDQLSASEPSANLAAMVCLRTAQAVRGTPEVAEPAATALAMVSQMGLVFTSLDTRGRLSTTWGMPRTLNAGDAFFAIAQRVLLSSQNEITATRRMAALRLLDKTTRALAEALHAAGDMQATASMTQRALLPAAVSLGALLGGADEATRIRLVSFVGRRDPRHSFARPRRAGCWALAYKPTRQ
jgi:hypothetical protein